MAQRRRKAREPIRRSPLEGRRHEVPKLHSWVIRRKRFTLYGGGLSYDVWRVENLDEAGGKARIILVPSPRRFNRSRDRWHRLPALKKRYLATKIANLLFPKNTAKAVALDEKKLRMEMRPAPRDAWLEDYNAVEMAADRLRYRSGYRKARSHMSPKELEEEKARQEQVKELTKAFGAQSYRDMKGETDYQGLRLPQVMEIMQAIEESGFQWERGGYNFSLSNPEQPVLFDIVGVAAPRLRKYLEKADLSARKRAQIEKLITEYEKIRG